MKTLKCIKVLIVEDNPVTLEALCSYMHSMGHDVVPSGNGLGASVALQAFRPDVVVIDHIMPALDGLGFIKRLRSNERTSDIPVVLITALAEGSELQKLRNEVDQLQPTRLMRKPFNPSDLLDMIREMPRSIREDKPKMDTNNKPEPMSSSQHKEGIQHLNRVEVEELRCGHLIISKTGDGKGTGLWIGDGSEGAMISLVHIPGGYAGQTFIGIYDKGQNTPSVYLTVANTGQGQIGIRDEVTEETVVVGFQELADFLRERNGKTINQNQEVTVSPPTPPPAT